MPKEAVVDKKSGKPGMTFFGKFPLAYQVKEVEETWDLNQKTQLNEELNLQFGEPIDERCVFQPPESNDNNTNDGKNGKISARHLYEKHKNFEDFMMQINDKQPAVPVRRKRTLKERNVILQQFLPKETLDNDKKVAPETSSRSSLLGGLNKSSSSLSSTGSSFSSQPKVKKRPNKGEAIVDLGKVNEKLKKLIDPLVVRSGSTINIRSDSDFPAL